MTEKRFTQKDEDDWEILDRNKHFAYAHSGYQAEKIITELNELVETNRELYKENKQLKKALLDIGDDRDYYKSKASSLEDGYIQLQDREIRLTKENEQLKFENNELKWALALEEVDCIITDDGKKIDCKNYERR